MIKIQVCCDKAPAAAGPYSQAITANGTVFVSGQLPVSPDGTIASGGIAEQTKQAMENLSEILKSAGSGLDNVVKTTVYLKNMNDFSRFNATYAKFFASPYPARSCIEAANLPKGALIEIEAVAIKNA